VQRNGFTHPLAARTPAHRKRAPMVCNHPSTHILGPEPTSAPGFVDAILEADKTAPRKQRQTAHRIWCRIRAEMPEVEVAESTWD
jgi:hypothetical protein